MSASGIKSKPVYEPLRVDPRGRYPVMLGAGPGSTALQRVLRELQTDAPATLRSTRLLYVPDAAPEGRAVAPFLDEVRRLGVTADVFGDTAGLLEAFRSLLERALMGTRLYIAGPESFIGVVLRIALEFNLNKDEIRAEELGTLARRVHCVHCRTTTVEVHTNIVACVGCGRWLTARDHYSRRIAAYMGVMVDAEAPGERPPIREMYP